VAEVVSVEAFERVLQIQTDKGAGAAFTITVGGGQWLVTARHVLPDGDPAPEVLLTNRYGSHRLRLGFIPVLASNADVVVARLGTPLTPELELPATSTSLMYSQPVFLLGYPFGMGLHLGGPPTISCLS
jgi:hypothetical protein